MSESQETPVPAGTGQAMSNGKKAGGNMIWVVALVVVAVVVAVMVVRGQDSDRELAVNEAESMEDNGQVGMGDRQDAADDERGAVMAEGENYVVYSQAMLAQVAQEGKKPVLFFHAKWCPTCKALDAELKRSTDKLNEDVVILKLDYDTEKELKAKYGITVQHTMVQVDEDGEEQKKWVGGGIELINEQVI